MSVRVPFKLCELCVGNSKTCRPWHDEPAFSSRRCFICRCQPPALPVRARRRGAAPPLRTASLPRECRARGCQSDVAHTLLTFMTHTSMPILAPHCHSDHASHSCSSRAALAASSSPDASTASAASSQPEAARARVVKDDDIAAWTHSAALPRRGQRRTRVRRTEWRMPPSRPRSQRLARSTGADGDTAAGERAPAPEEPESVCGRSG